MLNDHGMRICRVVPRRLARRIAWRDKSASRPSILLEQDRPAVALAKADFSIYGSTRMTLACYHDLSVATQLGHFAADKSGRTVDGFLQPLELRVGL
jgi:hypothetical protein